MANKTIIFILNTTTAFVVILLATSLVRNSSQKYKRALGNGNVAAFKNLTETKHDIELGEDKMGRDLGNNDAIIASTPFGNTVNGTDDIARVDCKSNHTLLCGTSARAKRAEHEFGISDAKVAVSETTKQVNGKQSSMNGIGFSMISTFYAHQMINADLSPVRNNRARERQPNGSGCHTAGASQVQVK